MRFLLGLSLAAGLAAADPAGAVLKRYGVHFTTIAEYNTANPRVGKYPPNKDGSTAVSVGIVDDTHSGSPVLERLALIAEYEITSYVPGLSGFIFLSMYSEEGPRKGLAFTGTGDTETSIKWGLVTGWNLTGGFWCHSSPTFICTYAVGSDLNTAEPLYFATFYDLGTWTFHGTGFTSAPFIRGDCPVGYLCPAFNFPGNTQFLLRGRLAAGIVPAVPVLGVALLGAALLFVGALLSRRR